ncbi:MAG: hypothetical protein ABI172_00210 [Ginsengibacter sp.]
MIQKAIAQDYPHLNEKKIISDISNIIKSSLENDYGRRKKMKRRLHAKSHGLLEAELIVEKNLPPSLQFGIFKTPKTFKALVRFSNGSPNVSDDYKKGVRGMSIKILNVDAPTLSLDHLGNTQDILLTNNKINFPGTVEMQKKAIQVLFVSKLYFILILLSFKWRGLITFLRGQIQIANVLEQSYYSGTPYLFGEGQAIKWQAKHLKSSTSKMPENPIENFLRERLSKDLSENEFYFDLCVQLQKDAQTEPIEDSAIEWLTPFIKVATIRILQQNFNTTERKQNENHILFSPWHSIAAHRPLGGINRIRGEIYKEMALLRKKHNENIIRNKNHQIFK